MHAWCRLKARTTPSCPTSSPGPHGLPRLRISLRRRGKRHEPDRSRSSPARVHLLSSLRERAQPQRVEADEADRVAVIVGDLAFFECHEVLVVERIGALAPDHAGVALV